MRFSDFQGAIFDVDDTLLDNYVEGVDRGLHEQSRLAAVHEVGRRHGIPALQAITLAQSTEAWVNAAIHTFEAATWEMLRAAGIVAYKTVDSSHPLLQEIIQTKNELHHGIIRTKGREVEGATRFVKALAKHDLQLAVASTSRRSDIGIFFEMYGLSHIFPEDRIICLECITTPKPHPEAFNLAFASLGLPEQSKAKVAAFEDHPRGIASAKAAGLFTCAITTPRFDRQSLAALEVAPDLIAESFAEFEQLLGLTSVKLR